VARPPLRLKGPEKQKLVELAAQPLTADQKAMVEAYAKAWPWPAGVIRRAYYKTYALARSLGLEDEEMAQICWFGAFRAARTYDPAYKASFATYAVSKMRGLLSHWISLQQSACRQPPNTLLSLDVKFAVPMDEQGEEDPRRDRRVPPAARRGARLAPRAGAEDGGHVLRARRRAHDDVQGGRRTLPPHPVPDPQQIVTRAVRKLKGFLT
jgi:DNA-directed RNA polymerase specialized sigma24 family protein